MRINGKDEEKGRREEGEKSKDKDDKQIIVSLKARLCHKIEKSIYEQISTASTASTPTSAQTIPNSSNDSSTSSSSSDTYSASSIFRRGIGLGMGGAVLGHKHRFNLQRLEGDIPFYPNMFMNRTPSLCLRVREYPVNIQ